MGHASSLKVIIETPYAETILKAIEPELSSLPSRRVKASARLQDGDLALEIVAEDLVALRAGMNALLRWVVAIDECLRLVDSRQ
ncbi:MAG: KEOPS complex subunit Pcc1 [Nitrososphaerota archaeon]